MTVRFTAIVPTIWRPSLRTTLASVADAGFTADDEIIVVAETGQPEESFGVNGHRVVYAKAPKPNWGGPQRNEAMRHAQGTHIIFMDDDDVWLPGAVTVMRDWAERHPADFLIFQMRMYWGEVYWRKPEAQLGEVGTPMFLVPNVAGKYGQWGAGYHGDWEFCESTLPYYPEPVFVPEIICQVRP